MTKAKGPTAKDKALETKNALTGQMFVVVKESGILDSPESDLQQWADTLYPLFEMRSNECCVLWPYYRGLKIELEWLTERLFELFRVRIPVRALGYELTRRACQQKKMVPTGKGDTIN